MKQPIELFRFKAPYRRFCSSWWKWYPWYVSKGFWADLRIAYHRARYGWAPRDTWNLDWYLNTVLAGSLTHLADHTHGTPSGYPYDKPRVPAKNGGKPRPLREGDDFNAIITDHEQWRADLKRWAAAFAALNETDDFYKDPEYAGQYRKQLDEENRRYDVVRSVLTEMGRWWGGLWD